MGGNFEGGKGLLTVEGSQGSNRERDWGEAEIKRIEKGRGRSQDFGPKTQTRFRGLKATDLRYGKRQTPTTIRQRLLKKEGEWILG